MIQNVGSILQRISLLEEEASSNTELKNRVRALRAQDTRDLSNARVDWEPSGSFQTKVVLMGDSNSSDKLKFGENRGTLGRTFPGKSVFCPTFAELKDPRSGTFTGATDVVVVDNIIIILPLLLRICPNMYTLLSQNIRRCRCSYRGTANL